jgi:hypothetical protein
MASQRLVRHAGEPRRLIPLLAVQRRLTAEQEAEIKAAVLAGPDIEKDGLSAFTLEDIRREPSGAFSCAAPMRQKQLRFTAAAPLVRLTKLAFPSTPAS